MKRLVVALLALVVFVSCTENNEIIEKNEQFETQLINKEDVTNPNNNGQPEVTIEED